MLITIVIGLAVLVFGAVIGVVLAPPTQWIGKAPAKNSK
jgi:hypothetical protein